MTYRQIATAFLCLFLIGSAEVVAGPMMGQMGALFGVTPSDVAYVPAAYGLSYAVVALLAGPLSDRLGRKRPLLWGLSGFAVLCHLMPMAASLAVAVTLSGLMGVCAAIVQPNVLSVVADESAPADLGRRIGQVFIGLMLAFVLTPALAGGLAESWGWGAAYQCLGVLALAALAAVLLWMPTRAPQASSPHQHFWAVHRLAWRKPGVPTRLLVSYLWLGWVAGFGAVVAEIAARKWQLAATDAGLLAGYFGAMVMLGNLLGGRLLRGLGDKAVPLLAVCSALGVLGFSVLSDHSGLPQLMAVGAAWALGYGSAGPLHHARLNSLSAGCLGTVNSYHASLLNLGIFSVSGLMGAMLPGASVSVFCGVVGAGAMLGALVLVRLSAGAAGQLPATEA